MTEILVTGGTGNLGRELVPRLIARGHAVRVLTRRERYGPNGERFVRGDLITGEGLDEAVKDVDAIVHCATGAADSGLRGVISQKATQTTDVDPTARMLERAKALGGSPFVLYISIVGIDRIPIGYYKTKLATERVIEASGLSHTILRTTQWHTLAAELGRRVLRGPVAFVPRGMKSQLLDAGEVAERMVKLFDERPAGRAPDMGGPEVLDLSDIVRSYARAVGKRRPVVGVPLPGKGMAGFRAGYNLTPEHADGRITWAQWLERNVSR